MNLERFVELWTYADTKPTSVSESALAKTEAHFGIRFPQDYREAVLRVGLPHPSMALLDTIIDRNADVYSIGDFLDPVTIIEHTKGWREIGLPDTLVAFATDVSGNLFCFAEATGSEGPSPIFFFDLEFGTREVIASSSTDWIDAYCALQPN